MVCDVFFGGVGGAVMVDCRGGGAVPRCGGV